MKRITVLPSLIILTAILLLNPGSTIGANDASKEVQKRWKFFSEIESEDAPVIEEIVIAIGDL